MGTHTIGEELGPFDKYTEVLVEKIGTVGVQKNTVVTFEQDDDSGSIAVVHKAYVKKVAKKAVKKATKK